jgi:acyl carrier protein
MSTSCKVAGLGSARSFRFRLQNAMSNNSILPRIQHLLQKNFLLTPDQVFPDRRLTDFAIDSLSMIEFMLMLENEFEISLPDERGDIRTVADIVNMVEKAASATTVAA